MLKTLLFLATLGLIQAQGILTPDCELFDNGCPVDFTISLLLPHETSCRSYYACVHGERVLRRCSRNTVFNPEEQACDHPANVDRTCEDDDSVERPPGTSAESVEIDFQPNGCPSNHSINWLLPHDTYCNLYFQCVWGSHIVRWCQPGLHFNATSQACDHPINVNCTLPGGDLVTSTSVRPPTTTSTARPPLEVDWNGCPVDQTINWLLPHENCTHFYHCVWGSLVLGTCPAGTHFNPIGQFCDNPATAGCLNFTCEDEGSCSEEDLPPGGDPESTLPPPTSTTTTPPPPPPPTTTTTTTPPPPPPPTTTTTTTTTPPPPPPTTTTTTTTPPPPPPTTTTTTTPPPPPPTTTTTTTPPPPPPTTTTTTPPPPPPTTTTTTTTPPPPEDCEPEPGNRCEEECVTFPWAHDDCDKYWICKGNTPVLGVCSKGLFFNPSTKTCDFACNVDCDSKSVRVTPEHEGLNLYIPWHKFDNNARQLLQAIEH